MKTLFYFILILAALSCKKTESDTVAPDYADWHTLKAPIDEPIQAVWGELESTLVIATTFKLYRSTDQGKNWQQVDQLQGGISGFVHHNDTLFVMTGFINTPTAHIMAHASKFSLDAGESWQVYRKYNPLFDTRSSLGPVNPKLYIDSVRTIIGTTYTINKVYLDPPTAVSRRVEMPNVITDQGRIVKLPQWHKIQSLYLDPKQRLYLAATDAICERSDSGKGYTYCNSKQGRGMVYISKSPLP